MHWGPYSVPGVSSEWFWYQVDSLLLPQLSSLNVPSVEQEGPKQRWRHGNCEVSRFFGRIRFVYMEPCLHRHMAAFYPPDFTYQQFGPQFRAEFFNATELVFESPKK